MIKKVHNIKTCLLIIGVIGAQSFDFLGQSNRSGIPSVLQNPANVSDNLVKIDIWPLAFHFSLYNNAFDVDLSFIREGASIYSPNFLQQYIKPISANSDISLFSNYEVLFPSFRMKLPWGLAGGFFIRRRFYINVENFNREIANLIYTQLKMEALWRQYESKNAFIGLTGWDEYAICIGKSIFNGWKHFIKGGVNLKLVRGLGNLYAYSDIIKYNFSDSVTLTFIADVHYGHSENFELSNYTYLVNPYLVFNKFPFATGLFPAIDLGVVYEFRPFYTRYLYEMDGNPDRLYENLIKYTLKIGLAFLDFGRIKFKRGEFSRYFSANIVNWDISKIAWHSVSDFDDTLKQKVILVPEKGEYWVELPSTFLLSLDFRPFQDYNFFIGYNGYFPLKRKRDPSKIIGANKHTITIRGEWRGLDVGFPVSYSKSTKNFKIGLMWHGGPFWFAISPINLIFLSSWMRRAEIQFGLQIPIFDHPPSDRDNDKVSDRRDECPDTPGLYAFKGCPDTDGDGVEDRYDRCPTVKGLPQYQGCPDTDGDGIPDLEDDCIDEPGPPQTKGCPDKDGDGIIDRKDLCPDLAGSPEWDGCPDSDNDGIPDHLDECPQLPGTKEFHGCPPVTVWLIDPVSNQKLVKGIRTTEGVFYFPKLPIHKKTLFLIETPEGINIPLPDEFLIVTETDTGLAILTISRTIRNLFEYIPPEIVKLKKLAEEGALIDIPEFEQKIIEKAMKNLHFNYNSAVINSKSFPYLDSLAEMLLRHPKWNIRLEGHTDSIGSELFNLELSKRRAEAVKNYLVAKGVQRERIEVKYWGEARPIAPNDTEENRMKNRRVEMFIIQPSIQVKE